MDPSKRVPKDLRSAALRNWNPQLFNDTYKERHFFSPSNIAKKIFHAPQTLGNKLSSAKKRRISQLSSNGESSRLKRVRGGLHDLDNNVIILQDSDDDSSQLKPMRTSASNVVPKNLPDLTHTTVLKFFRVGAEDLR